jgi:hypothetical protein
MMKKILSIFSLLCAGAISPAFAANDFIPFLTIEQAEQYCPAVNSLTFTPNNPTVPNSAGAVTGNKGIAFENIPAKKATRPWSMDASGLILGVSFRDADGMYGYSSNNVITCLYSYTNVFDWKYNLVLRGK